MPDRFERWLWLLAFVVVVPDPAVAQVHQRSGFTLELGMGPNSFQVFRSGSDPRAEFCPAMTIGIGGFFNESMALMLHLQAAPRIDGFAVEAFGINQLKFQNWFDDRFFLGAGAGFAIYNRSDAFEEAFFDDEGEQLEGFCLSLRTGYSFTPWENHSLRISLELVWAVFSNMHLLAETLALEWQWF